MNRPQPIEPHYAALLETKGFVEQFWKFLGESDTQEQAYELTEIMHESAFGKRKFANFESFLACRKNYLNKLKTKNEK